MPSIEDAAKSLQRTYLAAGFAAISGNKDTILAAFAAHEDAARTLALAVHWEMVEILRPLAPLVGKTNMAALYKANDAGVALRAQIENLGK